MRKKTLILAAAISFATFFVAQTAMAQNNRASASRLDLRLERHTDPRWRQRRNLPTLHCSLHCDSHEHGLHVRLS